VCLPPKVHAVDPLAWVSRVATIMHIAVRTYPRNDRHDPPAGIIVEAHVAFLCVTSDSQALPLALCATSLSNQKVSREEIRGSTNDEMSM
jgi:hypothetical protein